MPDKLPKGWAKTSLGEIRRDESVAISQDRMRGETFELYSVPACSAGKPEIIPGDTIGSNKVLVSPGDVLLRKINPRRAPKVTFTREGDSLCQKGCYPLAFVFC